MPYSIRYDPECDCLFASMEGDIDMQTLTEFGKEVGKLISEHGCKRILNDVRKIKIKLSTLEIYNLPKFVESLGIDRSVKRAVIVSQDFDQLRFFETVSRNVGQLLELFTDTDKPSMFRSAEEARDWLGLPAASE
jgi:hypothetical protein